MATVRIPDQERTIEGHDEIKAFLAEIGIGYENWNTDHPVDKSASNAEILEAYAHEIEELKASGGYVTADVIDVKPDTPGLDAMLNKFNKEHWHDEDEVRFIIEGNGLFHIRPREGDVVSVTVSEGDLLRVPAGTWHWFDLCGDKRIRAIRLFQDPSGWTPHYTESGADAGYMPLCFGLTFIPPQLQEL